jgi:membrane fusion protein (multidrug efflux system)
MKNNKTPQNPFWQPVKRVMILVKQWLSSSKAGKASKPIGARLDPRKKLDEMIPQAQAVVKAVNFSNLRKMANPKKLSRRGWIVVISLSALLVVTLIAWRLLRGPQNPYLSGVDMSNFDPRPTVESDVATQHALTRRIKTVGSLKATDSAVMKSEVAGVMSKIFLTDGAPVKKGDVLMQIDDAMQMAQYNARVSEYRAAKAEYERHKELFKHKIVPEQNLEQAQTKMEVARAQMTIEEVRVAQFKIKAPFDGIAGLRDVSVGTYVQTAQELITVVNLNPIKVDFKVPEAYFKDLALAQHAIVNVDGFEGVNFMASIDAIDPKVDPAGHSIHIRASIENIDAQLRPGMFANVELTLGEQSDALMIPESAIDRSGTDEFVYVLRDIRGEKVAIRTVITTGLRENGMVEILDGLIPGNEIVTAGHIKIRDGYQVRVTNNVQAATPQAVKGSEPYQSSATKMNVK